MKDKLADELTTIEQLHELWIARVKELRAAYDAAGIFVTEWKVSTGPGDRRDPVCEPDLDALNRLYRGFHTRDKHEYKRWAAVRRRRYDY